MMRHRKKLIEVALPLDAINRAAGAEKTIHVGTTSNLHAWWARRPLAACRAVLFASLVDDPAEYLSGDEAEKKRHDLFQLIERLVQWESNADEKVLAEAKAEIAASLNGNFPTVIDPFCGSGSIPVEALRLGLDAVGCDLNPIAVAISKAVVEVPAAVQRHMAVPSSGDERLFPSDGFSSFRLDLERFAKVVLSKAEQRARGLYGDSSNIVAWLWSRTCRCPNPGCRTRVPLLSSLWLSKTPKDKAFLRIAGYDRETDRVVFDVVEQSDAVGEPTIQGAGAICPVCTTPIPFAALREQGRAGDLGFQMNAVATKRGTTMKFEVASAEHERAALAVEPGWKPETPLPEAALGFRVQNYGLKWHHELFLPRQLAVLDYFSDALTETLDEIRSNPSFSKEYADAITVYLALFYDRFVQTNNCLVRWFVHSKRPSKAQPTFDKQTVQMVWDFAEANPLSKSTGGWSTCFKYPMTALDCLPRTAAVGRVMHGDSSRLVLGAGEYIFSTDPPYFDNIGYADLSDFFYVWLRRVLRNVYPEVFSTIVVPKDDEIIADPSRHEGDRDSSRKFFYERLGLVFASMRALSSDAFPATIYYAFKQEETTEGGGSVSTGWEGMLQALVDARWSITGTWPIRTEHSNRPRGIGSNALASSIVLVCRKRSDDAETITRGEFQRLLRGELPSSLRALRHSNIAPVDLAQAAIGPGMSVFSRYARVLDSGDQQMSVHAALEVINSVLDEFLTSGEADVDADTRFALTWFETHGWNGGPYNDAENLSKARNVSVSGIAEAGIISAGGGKVRLFRRSELDADWNPKTDRRPTVWEATQQLIKRLDEQGEVAAAELLAALGGAAEQARDLAYRLYQLCERNGWAEDARAYNGLVTAWPMLESAVANRARSPEQMTLDNAAPARSRRTSRKRRT
ncbi:MAG: DUF1156 domain-containing protein [Acidobacteriota bacterium]